MQKLRKILVLLTATLFVSAAVNAQTKDELQRKREQLLKEIEDTKAQLKTTREGKTTVLGELRVIEKDINLRNSMITNIKGEVYYVEKDIIKTYRDIDTLKSEIDILKEQYAQSIIYAYKNRTSFDLLNFLFSSEDFGDALRRMQYLKTYRGYREKKSEDILRAQDNLEGKLNSLKEKRQKKTDALSEQKEHMAELETSKKEKDKVMTSIRGQEKELVAFANKKEGERKKIQQTIQKMIQQEIAAAKKKKEEEAAALRKLEQERIAAQKLAAEKAERLERERLAAEKKALADKNNAAANPPVATTPPVTAAVPPPATKAEPKQEPVKKPASTAPKTNSRPNSVLESAPEVILESEDFERNKGNLPWPVDKGLIVLKYGNNVIDKVIIPSDGIGIETNIGDAVKSISSGEVKFVSSIGNMEIVCIQQGKYFITYGNLSGVSVREGQKISRGQMLGRAASEGLGKGQVTLQIDTERGTLNPEHWIKGRIN